LGASDSEGAGEGAGKGAGAGAGACMGAVGAGGEEVGELRGNPISAHGRGEERCRGVYRVIWGEGARRSFWLG
jgi:hypothetical protein